MELYCIEILIVIMIYVGTLNGFLGLLSDSVSRAEAVSEAVFVQPAGPSTALTAVS